MIAARIHGERFGSFTVFVSPWHAAPSKLPDGGQVPWGGCLAGDFVPRVELERIAERVHGWAELFDDLGAQVPCTRALVVGMITRAPDIRQQLVAAINGSSTSGRV